MPPYYCNELSKEIPPKDYTATGFLSEDAYQIQVFGYQSSYAEGEKEWLGNISYNS